MNKKFRTCILLSGPTLQKLKRLQSQKIQADISRTTSLSKVIEAVLEKGLESIPKEQQVMEEDYQQND